MIESALSRDELIEKLNNEPKLKKIGFKYSKNMDNIHDILVSNGGSLAKAIKNAKKLAANKQKNPSTGVFEFLEFFKRYINNWGNYKFNFKNLSRYNIISIKVIWLVFY